MPRASKSKKSTTKGRKMSEATKKKISKSLKEWHKHKKARNSKKNVPLRLTKEKQKQQDWRWKGIDTQSIRDTMDRL